MKIEQAFVMAAGRGKRMRPITDKIPKPLVRINGKSMLDMVLEKIELIASIQKIVVNAYYLSNLIEKHLKSLSNPKIIISKEDKKLETAGGLIHALPFFDQTKPILIVNSDIVWQDQNNESLELLIKNFNQEQTDIMLGLKPKEQFFGYEGSGDFNFDGKTGNLIKDETRELKYVYVGIQIFHPRIIKDYPKPPFSLNYFYKKAVRNDGVLDRLKGIILPGAFFHVGTVEAIKETESRIKLNKV